MYICIYKETPMEAIIIKIPEELKTKFKGNCISLGVTMTTVLESKIREFNNDIEKQKQKK